MLPTEGSWRQAHGSEDDHGMASGVSWRLMRAVWREGLVECWFAVAKPQKPPSPRGGGGGGGL